MYCECGDESEEHTGGVCARLISESRMEKETEKVLPL